MSKHTPGPWTVSRYLVDQDGREVGSAARGNLTERRRILAGPDVSSGPVIADMVAGTTTDAHLIAAAPDLLEALKDFIENVVWESTTKACDCDEGRAMGACVHIRARAAIRKAEGEQKRFDIRQSKV